ncbi:hypothetical protein HS7_09890 [Sulfolobales archaeon HS-7]|nr:hypothetical protein HS7_09890 [Sulfolobales archaeon HS-7]
MKTHLKPHTPSTFSEVLKKLVLIDVEMGLLELRALYYLPINGKEFPKFQGILYPGLELDVGFLEKSVKCTLFSESIDRRHSDISKLSENYY